MASKAQGFAEISGKSSHAKRISTHVAYALVVYTLLLIFEVSPQMESRGMSIMPYFILVILVGLVILPCRNFERRWQLLDNRSESDLDGLFRREVALLWFAAIGIPTALMTLIWVIP